MEGKHRQDKQNDVKRSTVGLMVLEKGCKFDDTIDARSEAGMISEILAPEGHRQWRAGIRHYLEHGPFISQDWMI